MRHVADFSIKRDREQFVHLFAKNQLPEGMYDRVMQQGNAFEFCITNSKHLPDNYIDVDVYVRFKDKKQECWFDLCS